MLFDVPGFVVKRGRVFIMPALAIFGRFGEFSGRSGTIYHPAREMPGKRKFAKNKDSGAGVHQGLIFGDCEENIKNYKKMFGS